MSGWSNKPWPSRSLTVDVGSFHVRIKVPHRLVNESDRDVSFAFCYCSSMGDEKFANAAMARGEAKAHFVPMDVNTPSLMAQVECLAPAMAAIAPGRPIRLTLEEDGEINLPERTLVGDRWTVTASVTEDGKIACVMHWSKDAISLSVSEMMRPGRGDVVATWGRQVAARCARAARSIAAATKKEGVEIVAEDEWDD